LFFHNISSNFSQDRKIEKCQKNTLKALPPNHFQNPSKSLENYDQIASKLKKETAKKTSKVVPPKNTKNQALSAS